MTFKGHPSPNPEGRPKGSGVRQKLFNDLVLPHKEKLIETSVNLALSGNEAMLKLLLEKLLPAKPSDEPIQFTLPDSMNKQESVLVVCLEILKAIERQELTPEQGKALASILETHRRLIETTELVARLSEIERVLKERKTK